MEIGVSKLCENIVVFSEPGAGSSIDAYLVVGSHRAALIDTLQDVTGLYDEVRKITSLPLDVLITHGHWDHVGKSITEFVNAGCTIYMDFRDFAEIRFHDANARVDYFTELKDGMVFDLGGYRLETISCPGHTAGSVAFLDREHQLLFSGDTIGSGNFWIQLPGSSSLEEFLQNLQSLKEKLQGIEQLMVHPGHRGQMPEQLTGAYIDNIYAITEDIINGNLVGREDSVDLGNIHVPFRTVEQGMVSSYCYNPEKIHLTYKEALFRLLSLEYNCTTADFAKTENVLTVSELLEGRRMYSSKKYFFHMVTTGGNAVITADECLHPFLREFMKDRTGHWLFELPNLLPLEKELNRFGYSLTQTYHMFLPAEQVKITQNYSVKWFYGQEEIEQFYGDKRFSNAICSKFLPHRPDRIVVCAYDGDRIMGMAGCSEDAPHWMQIGIDVLPEYRSNGVGSYLVNLLKNKIEEQGDIPFYGTSVSNYHSWNIALNCGFRPAWVEIGAEKMK